MRIILLNLCLFISLAGYSQNGTITGATQVPQGAVETYYVNFPYSGWDMAYWEAYGGTVLYSDDFSCTIQWNNENTTGYISVTANVYGQYQMGSANLSVQVGDAQPYIYPTYQTLYYGNNPFEIIIGFNFTPPGSVIYQWQIWNEASSAWDNLANQTNTFYPPAATANTRYRCLLNVNGTIYTTLESLITIPALNPGYLSLTSLVDFNTLISGLNASAATGGLCSSYTYIWEQSVENGPWVQIGTGQNYPANAPVIGTTIIRRKVICGNQELYANTLVCEPVYASVDFENLNYVREIAVAKKGIISWQQADQLTVGDKFQTTVYLDGFGRPLQKVDKEISSTDNSVWKDMVQHYDYTINENKSFLPFATSQALGKFKQGALNGQETFIRDLFQGDALSTTYSYTKFDESPLNRPVKSIAPGYESNNNGVGVSLSYDFNNEAEKVHIWELDFSLNSLPTTSAFYPTGKLSKSIIIDEKDKKVVTYTDFSGNAVLKKVQLLDTTTNEHAGWACTYYVYDDFNQLRYIITPKAVEHLDNNGWSVSQALVDELCFKNVYDQKGRIVVKKQPGAGEVKMVYDNKNRLVLAQHANQVAANNPALTNNQWTFSLYDELNNTIATGLVENNSDRASIQNAVNQLNNESETVSAFVGNGTNQIIEVDNPVVGSTGSSSYIAGNQNVIFNSVTHYNDYGYNGAKPFNASNIFAYDPNNSSAEQTVKTIRTMGFVTGEKIRVLDDDNNYSNDNFLYSTAYYDENGNSLQTLTDNIKGGIDYQTSQYDFSGKLLSTYLNHSLSGGNTVTVTTKNEFDRIGRLTGLYKNFNSSFYKQLGAYSYNELGQLKTKRLAPGYTATGKNEIESQTFSYNIKGLITGINKAYALSDNNYNQWDNYFGLYLGYENRDNLFIAPQHNATITGAIWKSQGDNAPRKFDYEYDNLGRFKSALFKQKNKPADAWSNAEVDFSVWMEYEDGNGNIKSMKQMGIVPGVNGGILIDDLRYSYKDIAAISGLKNNQLKQVDDLGVLSAANNGILGDFNDKINTEDYFYDSNGNLVTDLNKNIVPPSGGGGGITYNFLDKPAKITIQNKSVIEYTYDASGLKLTKKVTDVATNITKTTYYNGDFIYQENELQFIVHEEGRLKLITPLNTDNVFLDAGASGVIFSGGKKGVFEYFIKDHLGSTRMVLTEEEQKEFYRATMERTAAAGEEPLFGKVNADGSIPAENELKQTRIENNDPSTSPWPNHTTDFVKLTSADPAKAIGPNMILKVMAGDIIRTSAKYYYYLNNPSGGTANPVNTVIGSFINALLSAGKGSGAGKVFSTEVNNNLSATGALNSFITNTQPNSGNINAPKAYLNIVFLDEQFKFIAADDATPDVGTNFERVSSADNADAAFGILSQKAPKNGWVYVYLSNESNESVYFDDFYVTQEHSRITEESHFYPYGLKIAGISSKAFNKLRNNYGYQGDYSEAEEETGYDEFYLRSYDPQIGRWTGADPYDEFASPYVGMGNDPVNMVDPTGGFIWTTTGSAFLDASLRTTAASILGGVIGGFLDGEKGWKWSWTGAAIVGGGMMMAGIDWNAVGAALGDAGNWLGSNVSGLFNADDWIGFYKTDLIKYVLSKGISPTENNLGTEFEKIFETFAKEFFPKKALALSRFRQAEKKWTEANDRNSKPDFVADDFYDISPVFWNTLFKRVNEGSGWEVKQNNGRGIYLSSNDGQIRGHIKNLAAKHAKDIATGDYNPMLALITTYDVNYSYKTLAFATFHRVQYTHSRSKFRIVRGKYKFKFVNFGDKDW